LICLGFLPASLLQKFLAAHFQLSRCLRLVLVA
jgi:hypothetical protein